MHVIRQLKSTYGTDWAHEDVNCSILNEYNATLQDRLQNVLTTLDELFCSTNSDYASSTTISHGELHEKVSKVKPVESEKGALQLIFIAAILRMIPQEYTLDAQFCTNTRVARTMKPIVGCSSIAIRNIFTSIGNTMGLPVSFVYDANNGFAYRSMDRKSVHCDTMNTATTRDRLFKTFCDQEDTIRLGQRFFCLCVDEGTGNVVVEWTDSNNPWEVLRWAPR